MTENDDRTPADQSPTCSSTYPSASSSRPRRCCPSLRARSRPRTRNARLFGQFAVRQGEAEVRRRLASSSRPPGSCGRSASCRVTTRIATALAKLTRPAPAPLRCGPTILGGQGRTSRAGTRRRRPRHTDYDSLSASRMVTRPGLTSTSSRRSVPTRWRTAAARRSSTRSSSYNSDDRRSVPRHCARGGSRTAAEADIPQVATLWRSLPRRKLGQKGGALWAAARAARAAGGDVAVGPGPARPRGGRGDARRGGGGLRRGARPRRFWTAGCWA